MTSNIPGFDHRLFAQGDKNLIDCDFFSSPIPIYFFQFLFGLIFSLFYMVFSMLFSFFYIPFIISLSDFGFLPIFFFSIFPTSFSPETNYQCSKHSIDSISLSKNVEVWATCIRYIQSTQIDTNRHFSLF